ncbi:BZ3500_MvSof-1268-A1-R1_Chr1-3g01679 [Microbotryum saponariae]|uniref:BZ3500_MvSof-1268-A1-R1_Chr1-3g01679 protein n=1 Tax=Microbotryum saponariae TaxID=289078 RepID=A0A2X0LED0_9BASI|nr:BZ3500_MvSof-1268-A1-R1_Chr1-3g01679 [Microbotryum saponariae]SCZ94303.1 BZ3501_MvSof-1269-A2-R1_Chr1-3g01280 [Microbotryum saponariae]
MLCPLTAPLLALIATSSILISNVSALPTRRSIGIKRLNNVVVVRSTVDSTMPSVKRSTIPNPKKNAPHRRSLQDAEDDYEDNREMLDAEPYRFAKLVRSVVGGSSMPTARAITEPKGSVEAISFGKAFTPRSNPKHIRKRGGLMVGQDEEEDDSEIVGESEEDQAAARLAKRSRIITPNPKARISSPAVAQTPDSPTDQNRTTTKASRAYPVKIMRARSSMVVPKAGSKVRRAAIQPLKPHVYVNLERSI